MIEIENSWSNRNSSCSWAKKCRAAKLKGADIVIESEDNNIRDKLTLSMGADVIYDPIGGENFRPVLSLANPEARILPIGFASGKAR